MPSGATNVVLNLTVVSPSASGWGTTYPGGAARPVTSNLNYMTGRTTARQMMVSPSADGRITLWLSAAANVLVDVQGYTPSDGPGYRSASPTRLLDTRAGNPFATGTTRQVTVLGRGGVPATGVSAVVLSVVGTRSRGSGYLSVYPHAAARPTTSNLNTATGQTESGQVIVQPGAGGAIDLYAAARTDVVVDLVGYIVTGSNYVPAGPFRTLDQRTGLGVTTGNDFSVRAPADAVAVFANLTAIGTPGYPGGSLTLSPGNTPSREYSGGPSTSNVNFASGSVTANAVLTGLGVRSELAEDGLGTGNAKAVADVFGYLTSPTRATTAAGASTTIPASYPYGSACSADGSCAVLDYFGHVLFSQPDGSWRVTSPPSQSLRAIACSSPDRCVVSDSTRQYLWDGSTWTPASVSGAVSDPALACPAAELCVLVGDQQGYVTTDGNTWTAVPALAGLRDPQVSCSSASACLVTDASGVQVRWDGTSWSRLPGKAPLQIMSLSCPSDVCVAATPLGALWTRAANGVWTQSGSVTPTPSVGRVGVRCMTAIRCLVAGGSVVKAYDGSSWNAVTAPEASTAQTLACTPAGCVVGWASGRFSRWSGAAFSDAFQPVRWWLGVSSVACASPTRCFATADGSGWIQEWDGSGWSQGGPGTLATANAATIGCLSSTLCFSTAGRQWTPETGWTASGQPAGVWGDDLWCEPGGLCVVRTSTALFATAGHGWFELGGLPDVHNLVGVSCPTTSWCMLQGDYGAAMVWRGSGFSSVPAAFDGGDAVVVGVTCTSSSACITATTGGSVGMWNGREWAQLKVPSAGSSDADLPSEHCTSGGSCVVTVGDGELSVWNGQFWSAPTAAPQKGFECVGGWCLAYGMLRQTDFTPFTYAAMAP